MEKKALILTQKRLTTDHYLALAIDDARTVLKPPVTMNRFWKHFHTYEDTSKLLDDIVDWITDQSKPGDYLVLEGEPEAIEKLREGCQNQELRMVYPTWDPDVLRDFDSKK